MKKVIVVHGWGGSPAGDWFPWLKYELEKKSAEVVIPEMPDTFHPKIEDWVSELKNAAGNVDENTILIGHSIGCQAVMRFVEELPKDIKVGGIVLVAAWMNLTDETWDEEYTREIAEPWLETPINFDKIKEHTNNIICVQSKDDPYVSINDTEIFKEKLGATIIFLENAGHISAEDGITELPEVLVQINNITEAKDE